jgi:small subunit ribosomal protein S13
MIYILNTSLQGKKKIRKSLSKIYGIGPTLSNIICDQLGLGENLKLDQLSNTQIQQISQMIGKEFLTGSELSRFVGNNKSRLGSIGSYRGLRQNLGLPLRGQRTHGNARTARKLRKKI